MAAEMPASASDDGSGTATRAADAAGEALKTTST